MASGDSKFDDLSEADIDSLIDDAVPKNTKKSNCLGNICFERFANFKFFIHASCLVYLVYSCFSVVFLCAVYSI